MDYTKILKDIGYLNAFELKELSIGQPDFNWVEIVNVTEQFIRKLKWNTNNLLYRIMVLDNDISIIYFDGTFICSIPSFNSVETLMIFEDHFLHLKDMYIEAYKKRAYSNILGYIDKKFQAITYNIFYERMSRKERFYNFLELNKHGEYVKTIISSETIKEILSYKPDKANLITRLSKLLIKDDYINVFRIGDLESIKVSGEISWATEITAAKTFGHRFGHNGDIVRGKVHISNIAYIYEEEFEKEDSDLENEVLVVPDSVTGLIILN